MKYVTHIESSTGRSVAVDKPSTALAGEMLEVRYDLERIKREVSPRDIAAGPANLWRYAPLLPVADPRAAVSLGEGYTPLLDTPRLARALGLQNLAVKDEGRNPSGTFKDRGASVAISRYVELGVKTVAHNSSGNAGGSWSLYAARAGITCVNLLPTDVQPSSLQHCRASGQPAFLVENWHVDVDDAIFGLAQFLGQTKQVGRIQRRGLLRQPADQIGVANDGHAVLDGRLAGFGEFAVAALFGRHIDDDAARLHALHHLRRDQLRRRLTGNQRRGNDDVHFPRLLRVHFPLGLLEPFAHAVAALEHRLRIEMGKVRRHAFQTRRQRLHPLDSGAAEPARQHVLSNNKRTHIRAGRSQALDQVPQLPLPVGASMRPRAAQPASQLRNVAQLIGNPLAGMHEAPRETVDMATGSALSSRRQRRPRGWTPPPIWRE